MLDFGFNGLIWLDLLPPGVFSINRFNVWRGTLVLKTAESLLSDQWVLQHSMLVKCGRLWRCKSLLDKDVDQSVGPNRMSGSPVNVSSVPAAPDNSRQARAENTPNFASAADERVFPIKDRYGMADRAAVTDGKRPLSPPKPKRTSCLQEV